jgi:hypothetical protein
LQQRGIAVAKTGRTFRNSRIVVGILSIIAEAATTPHPYLGILGSPSRGVTFAAFLAPFVLPILNIIGIVLGLASITAAFASEKGASVLASVAFGLALILSTSWGSLTWGHYDVGWPLSWAHRFVSLGLLPETPPMFYLDLTGLLIDLAF